MSLLSVCMVVLCDVSSVLVDVWVVGLSVLSCVCNMLSVCLNDVIVLMY